jgi:ribosomal protein S18 acetylase RimI-like enzyme
VINNPSDDLIIGGEKICTYLKWDSDFFNTPIARLLPYRVTDQTMYYALEWCKKQNIRCLYYLADPLCSRSLLLAGSNNFNLVDIRITLSQEFPFFKNKIESSGNLVFNKAVKDDLPSIIGIVQRIQWQSRFFYDQNFERSRVNKFYILWVERSFQKDNFEEIVISYLNYRPVGFIICRFENNTGKISLLGVDPDSHGLEIGTQLVLRALELFRLKRSNKAEVVTQDRNTGANRLYKRCGFVPESAYNWYHKWF